MVKKNLRTVLRVGVATVCAALSFGAHATAYPVSFDPISSLFGVATIDVSAPCLSVPDGIYTLSFPTGCSVSFVSAHISVTGPGGPFTGFIGPETVSFSTLVIVNHQLQGLATSSPILLDMVGGAFLISHYFEEEECDPTLAFVAPTPSKPLGTVTFGSCPLGGAMLTGTITSFTPEPGTLALLLGAGVAGWLSRRRWLAV